MMIFRLSTHTDEPYGSVTLSNKVHHSMGFFNARQPPFALATGGYSLH